MDSDFGVTDATEPSWSTNPISGVTQFKEDDYPFDTNGENEVVWEAVENRVGLEVIRFTIRYRDQSTGQERQLTIVHSFADD